MVGEQADDVDQVEVTLKLDELETKDTGKEERKGGESLHVLYGSGIAYTINDVLTKNIGADELGFMRYHQEFQKAYKDLGDELREAFSVSDVNIGKYGLAMDYNGDRYVFSKDYRTGDNLVTGVNTSFATYLQKRVQLDGCRVEGRYLNPKQVEEVRHVAVEQFIILPTEQSKKFKRLLSSYSLNRPKDWLEGLSEITEELGLEVPKMGMEQGDIHVYLDHEECTVEWKNSVESAKELVDVMCKVWEKDEESNRKPDNTVVKGGGITLVNLTKEQKEYRQYIEDMVKKALGYINNVNSMYKITYSNTTTSCYVDFTYGSLYDLNISIRDHEEMHENGYIKFYIDAVGREDFSKRLAKVLESLVQQKRDEKRRQGL